MAIIIDKAGVLYHPYSCDKEAEFESTVSSLASQIFGASTIYIDVKKKISGNDIISIPDGYVIDMTVPDSPKLFVVENEIVGHDPFRHIGVQMLKFVTSFEDAQVEIRNLLMNEISKDPAKLTKLNEGCAKSSSRNIDAYLDSAVYSEFRGIVVIDEARNELHQILERINANISVLELRTFKSVDGTKMYQFDTLYDEYEDDFFEISLKPERHDVSAGDDRARRRARRAACDTIVVPAREEGFKRVFLGQNMWYAIRIGAAMKDRIKHIAAYQKVPVGAVTHIAEVQDIRPYKDTGKYMVVFKGPARQIGPIKIREPQHAPQGPIYVESEKLLNSKYLDDTLSE